jgi:hypothetical protein
MERQYTLQQNRRFCTFYAAAAVPLALLGLAGMLLQWKMPTPILFSVLVVVLLIPVHRLQVLVWEYKLRIFPFYLIPVAIYALFLYLYSINHDPQEPIYHFYCYSLLAFYSLFTGGNALRILHKLPASE